jgi:hypothetical protein
MVAFSFHHDEPCCLQLLISFAPQIKVASLWAAQRAVLVPFAQTFLSRQEQSEIEAAGSFARGCDSIP